MRHQILLTIGTAAIVAGGALAPVATAASAGHTVKVTAKSAYVDDKAPGRVFSGTIFKGNKFKIDRVARVRTGTAKARLVPRHRDDHRRARQELQGRDQAIGDHRLGQGRRLRLSATGLARFERASPEAPSELRLLQV